MKQMCWLSDGDVCRAYIQTRPAGNKAARHVTDAGHEFPSAQRGLRGEAAETLIERHPEAFPRPKKHEKK